MSFLHLIALSGNAIRLSCEFPTPNQSSLIDLRSQTRLSSCWGLYSVCPGVLTYFVHLVIRSNKERKLDLNQRPSGYGPDELPNCSIPLEHVTGFEPVPPAWKAGMLSANTTHAKYNCGNEIRTHSSGLWSQYPTIGRFRDDCLVLRTCPRRRLL